MTSPAIRTTHLSKQFGAVRAIDQLTLEIPRGIVFGFLGLNGSGKTTTISGRVAAMHIPLTEWSKIEAIVKPVN